MDTPPVSLNDLRHQAGISQEEMAHRLGISRSYYNALERGRRTPGQWLQKSIEVVRDELVHSMRTNVHSGSSSSYQQPDAKSMVIDELERATANRDDILSFLRPWIELSGANPNVAPYVLTQLRKHLPHDDLTLFAGKPPTTPHW